MATLEGCAEIGGGVPRPASVIERAAEDDA
jgi:hypothetical protein